MASERIALSERFETLIAQAGLSKAELALRAGVNRLVIFRALNPHPYDGGGTLRGTTAWKLAQAYAEQTDLDLETAFTQLFVVTGREAHRGDTSESTHQEAPDGIPTAPRQSASIRLDDESLSMLAALMQDEDRSNQREMIRVLIKRAYRALVAQRSATEDTIPKPPNSH